MGIIAWIIFGALVGWIASKIMNTDAEQGGLANIFIGIIGAVIGGLVFSMFGGQSVTGFNLYSALVALVGAVLLIIVLKALNVFR
jgi:uncharacterized membrane protein YeaQ/YmgE (transglycosylase-associated protein family)